MSDLDKALADLREAGFLHSHRGKMGGYCLSRPSHLISLGEIIRVIEGPLALVPCVSRTAYRSCKDCKDEASCAIRHAMMRVRDETARILDGTSLADSVAEDLVAAERAHAQATGTVIRSEVFTLDDGGMRPRPGSDLRDALHSL